MAGDGNRGRAQAGRASRRQPSVEFVDRQPNKRVRYELASRRSLELIVGTSNQRYLMRPSGTISRAVQAHRVGRGSSRFVMQVAFVVMSAIGLSGCLYHFAGGGSRPTSKPSPLSRSTTKRR